MKYILIVAAFSFCAFVQPAWACPTAGDLFKQSTPGAAQKIAHIDQKIYPSDATVIPCDIDNLVVGVHNNGTLIDLTGHEVKDQDEPTLTDTDFLLGRVIDQLKVNIESLYDSDAETPVRILIFAHGGMVSNKDAVDNARNLAPAMMRDGYAPLFLVWNSDFPTAYGDRLCCVRDGFYSKQNLWWYAPIRIFGDLASSVGTAPENYTRQFVRFKQSVVEKHSTNYFLYPSDKRRDCAYFEAERRGQVSVSAPTNNVECPNVILPFMTASMNGHDSFGVKEVEYAGLFIPRILTTAIGSQVGANAWSNMVRRTRLGFSNESHWAACPRPGTQRLAENTKPNHRDKTQPNHMTCQNGGFTLFFDRLQNEIEFDATPGVDDMLRHTITTESGRKIPIVIEFYGHSMGAIVGNELLYNYPDLPYSRVVYMAAASSIRNFKLAAAPVITLKHIPFYNLTLHPLNESRELNMAGAVPQGSLLEWIDEMFDAPRSFDDRTLGKWKNVESTLGTWQPATLKQMTIRVFPKQHILKTSTIQKEKEFFEDECEAPPPDGPNARREVCYPLKHGEFNDYTFWRPMYLTGSDTPPSYDDNLKAGLRLQ